MSRKHCCPKRGLRSRSRYKDRLAARGLKASDVLMEDVETLRKRQERDAKPGQSLADAIGRYRTATKGKTP